MKRRITMVAMALLAACSLGSLTKPARSADAASQPASTQTQPAKRYPARQFSPKVRMMVYIQVSKSDDIRDINYSPTDKPLEIPACQDWWVSPTDAPLADVVKEVEDQAIPGLELPLKITNDDLALLQGLTRLQRLDMYDATTVTDAGLEHLKGLTSLRWLNLHGTSVKDAGLEHLKGMTGLQTLDLTFTRVTDAGLEHLKVLTELQTLNLSVTKVTDAGLEHINGLTELKELHLMGTKVTDAGLDKLKGLAGLQTLNLESTRVTDAGLEHLKGLTKLRTLYVNETRVTDAGVAALKKAIPGIYIVRRRYGTLPAEPQNADPGLFPTDPPGLKNDYPPK